MWGKLIAKGSEGEIYLAENDPLEIGKEKYIIKFRRERKYRHKLIDESLRKYRTRREGKILVKAKRLGINVPEVYKVDEKKFLIAMEFVEGKPLTVKTFRNYVKEMAEIIKKLHENDIVHGDLHPKNFIRTDKGLYVIDFGLSFVSQRVEDKAVDLFELKKLLKSNNLWEEFAEVYGIEEVLRKLEEIEKRGRYKLQV